MIIKNQISVIILIYKSENTIERCARSLFEQTMDDLEFIFVNDASPDNSIKILKKLICEYPHRKPNIKIIEHKQNMGTSISRNTGLNASSGTYIVYCDSDDWVEPDMYEELFKKATESNADIVGCDYYYVTNNKRKYVKQIFNNNDTCINESLKGSLHCAMWNKLIKGQLYFDNHVSFPDGINMWEDVATIIRLYFYSKNIAYVPRALYNYTYSKNSITAMAAEKYLSNQIEVVSLLEKFFRCNSIFDKYCSSFIWLQFQAKYSLLRNRNRNSIIRWKTLYPETNHIIHRYTKGRLIRRLIYYFNSYELFIISMILENIMNILIKFRTILK